MYLKEIWTEVRSAQQPVTWTKPETAFSLWVLQSWTKDPQTVPENKYHAFPQSSLIRETILLVLLLIRELPRRCRASTCTFFSWIVAIFTLLSNCLSYLSPWFFVFTSYTYHRTTLPSTSVIQTETSDRVRDAVSHSILMVPVGPAHSAIWVALWKLLLVFTHWHLLGRQASCVPPCAAGHFNPIFWF